MMIQIQPQYISLGGLMRGRLFRIPEYQRAYSWYSKQRNDLFGDINRTWRKGSDTTHFMATVVGLRRDKVTILTDEHHVVEIVDGQQRITTLILLLKAIGEAVDRSDAIGKRIGEDIDETLVKPDKASLLLLQTNHDLSNYFADYMRNGSHPSADSAATASDRELLLAIDECEGFVRNWQQKGIPLADLVALLKNRLTFVFHEIADEALVYTVFEVLNSRGLDVSWFDRLKTALMADVFESDTGNKQEIVHEVHQLWTDIFRCVGLQRGLSTQSLRFAATLRDRVCPNRPLSEEAAVHLLRTQSLGEPDKVLETVRWLKSVTEAVYRLVGDRRKTAVTKIAQARLVATAINLRQDLDSSQKQELLDCWESVTFRIYGLLDKDARTAVGDYVRLAWSIVNKGLPHDFILKALSTIGAAHPIEKAIDYRRARDSYSGWQEELRYFFCRYEEYLAKRSGQIFNNEQWSRIWEASAADSVEHIRAQSWWEAAGLPFDLDYVHRLGNLLILSPKLNSKLGTKSPAEKADDYRRTGLLIAQEVLDVLPDWDFDHTEKREESLLEWARHEWAD